MRSIIYLFLCAVILSLSVAPVYAEKNENMMKYRGTDQNNDGKITREEWQSFFNNHDWNGDGVISGDEMKPGARRWGSNSASPDQFKALDRNNDNVISTGEWTGTMQEFNRLDQDQNSNLSVNEFHQRSGLDQFSEFDHNNDGVISREEWHNTSQSFDALDTNRDGKISRDEFYNQQQYPVSVFRELDQNNDVRISRAEWRSTSDTFTRLDINGDNLLSEEEFNSTTTSSQGSRIVEQIFQEIFRKR